MIVTNLFFDGACDQNTWRGLLLTSEKQGHLGKEEQQDLMYQQDKNNMGCQSIVGSGGEGGEPESFINDLYHHIDCIIRIQLGNG